MNKSKILEISKLKSTDLHTSKNTDIDTLIHKAVYNLSQSSFDYQLDHQNKRDRYFIDVVYPATILKICKKLSNSNSWRTTKEKLSAQEGYISSAYEAIQQFKNSNVSDNQFYLRNKEEINDQIEQFCTKYERLYFEINQRLIAYDAIMNENAFRKEFMCHKEFPKSTGRFNFNKLLSKNTADRIQWKKDSLRELTESLGESDSNQTIIKSFANFCAKVRFEPDAPVYGTSFVMDFMPELISRLTSNTADDWDREIDKLHEHCASQQQMIGGANKIITNILRFEKSWDKDSELIERFRSMKEKLTENNNDAGLSL